VVKKALIRVASGPFHSTFVRLPVEAADRQIHEPSSPAASFLI